MEYSDDMFLGRGVYLAKDVDQALEYGDTVVEVTLPDDVRVCGESNLAGIGTFEAFRDDLRHGMYRDQDEKGREGYYVSGVFYTPDEVSGDSELARRLYQTIADERNEDAECPVIETETQVVIYDRDVVQRLNLRIIDLTDPDNIDKLRFKFKHRRPVRVRQHTKRSR